MSEEEKEARAGPAGPRERYARRVGRGVKGAGPGSSRLPGELVHAGSWSSVGRTCRHLLCAPPRACVPGADSEDEDGVAGDWSGRRPGLLRRRLGRREPGERRREW